MPDAVVNLADSGVPAEFRQVASVFISFAEPPDQQNLRSFVTIVLKLVYSYGGYFNKLDFGDKGSVMLVLFGAPIAHENDVVRAADFLLSLRAYATDVRWRAGLTFETVYAGFIGGFEHSEYTAIGDAVNLAARMMMQAEWGDIWMSPLAAQRLRGKGYRTETLGVYAFKGKSNALAVTRLLGKRADSEEGQPDIPQHRRGQLVGRDAELAHLMQWVIPLIDAAPREETPDRDHLPRIIVIYGDPGIGKSCLVDELRLRCAMGRRLRWFSCPSDEIMRQSLNPFERMLHGYLDQSPERTVEENKKRFDQLLDLLIASVPPDYRGIAQELQRTRSFLGAIVNLRWNNSLYEQLDPKLRFDNMLLAFRTFLQAESLRQPVVVQLEDMQWLDTDSQELIRSLAHVLHDHALVLLCVSRYRDDGSQVPLPVDSTFSRHTLELTPLTVGHVQTLAAHLLDGAVTDEVIQFLVEKTNGNPFFVEQLILDLREREAITWAGAGWQLRIAEDIDVPTSISAVLTARLDRLSSQVKQVVQTAAVLGHEFALQVLVAMLRGDVGVFQHVSTAEAERIWSLISEWHYLFTHPLLRDAAYTMQLRTQLRELHTLAGAAIEQVYADHLPPKYADLAYHYGQAEDLERERRYARLAGEWAATRFANREAVRYLSRALELTPVDTLPERWELLSLRERVYDLQGTRSAQNQDLDELEKLANQLNDNQRRAYAVLRWANCADRLGDYPGMIAASQGAIYLANVLQSRDIEAAGYLQWARALWYQGEYDTARQRAEQSLELARKVQSRQLEADSLRTLGNVALYEGNYPEARTAFEQSLYLCRELSDWYGESGALNNLGIIAFYQGDYARARDCYEQSLHLNRQAGDQQGESMALGNLGEVAAAQGDYAAAQTSFEQTLRLYREMGDQYGESLILFNLGEVAATLGDYTTARSTFEQSLEICRAIGHRQHESLILAKMSLLAHRMGANDDAYAFGQQALGLAREVQDPNSQAYALTHLGHALVELDRMQAAADAYQQALHIRSELEQPHQAMEPLAGLARIALAQHDVAEAQRYAEQILHHLETQALDGTDEPFRVYLTCYHVLASSNDPRAATTLTTAYQLLQERAAMIGNEALLHSYLNNVAAHCTLRRIVLQ